MNIIDLQDKLKNLSQQQLIQEMQMPTGQMPQFLVLSELTRRKKMEDSFAIEQGRDQSTVAQDAVSAAGMPAEFARQMAGAMAPQTDMAGNTGAMPQQSAMPPQRMAGGGIVALQDGGGPIRAPRLVVRTGSSSPKWMTAASSRCLSLGSTKQRPQTRRRHRAGSRWTLDRHLGPVEVWTQLRAIPFYPILRSPDRQRDRDPGVPRASRQILRSLTLRSPDRHLGPVEVWTQLRAIPFYPILRSLIQPLRGHPALLPAVVSQA